MMRMGKLCLPSSGLSYLVSYIPTTIRARVARWTAQYVFDTTKSRQRHEIVLRADTTNQALPTFSDTKNSWTRTKNTFPTERKRHSIELDRETRFIRLLHHHHCLVRLRGLIRPWSRLSITIRLVGRMILLHRCRCRCCRKAKDLQTPAPASTRAIESTSMPMPMPKLTLGILYEDMWLSMIGRVSGMLYLSGGRNI